MDDAGGGVVARAPDEPRSTDIPAATGERSAAEPAAGASRRVRSIAGPALPATGPAVCRGSAGTRRGDGRAHSTASRTGSTPGSPDQPSDAVAGGQTVPTVPCCAPAAWSRCHSSSSRTSSSTTEGPNSEGRSATSACATTESSSIAQSWHRDGFRRANRTSQLLLTNPQFPQVHPQLGSPPRPR